MSSSSNFKITHLIKESEHLCIPFEDIKKATENFTTLIGEGGYGLVYKGELLLSGKHTSVAVKRLDNKLAGQGLKEFIAEIDLLSRHKHPNLVSLLGFCEEDGEKILVYDYAEHGSLDIYLTKGKSNIQLTWLQRLNICIDAARGLDYLHNHVAQNHRVIHRDIKSANILLSHDWKAMIADFGLSLIGPANENVTFIIIGAAGTRGYCDPEYINTGILTKESDVYSFGVVLFDVLCGKSGFIHVNNKLQHLGPLAERYYNEGRLEEIIDPYLKTEVDSDSLNMFSEIAYQCLLNDRKQRPSISLVVQKLEKIKDLHSVSMNQLDLSTQYGKPQISLNEKQIENQELLIKCITQHVGFSSKRPVAACTIYKCLLQWRSFEVERTTIFDSIIQTIGHAIEISQDNNDILAYWMSNTSTLLLLLLSTPAPSGVTAALGPQHRQSSATLFGGMNTEAKYPALSFKQQLMAYVEKIYEMIRDNMKKEISPLLELCIQAPRSLRASLVKGESRTVNNVAQQGLIAHWQEIVKSLGDLLNTLQINHVSPFFIRKLFPQIFSFINVKLFNSLFLRRECCSFSYGEYVKAGLAELDDWCYNVTDEYAGTAWYELQFIRQAIKFMVIHHKPKETLQEIRDDLCPCLTIDQLFRISTMYWDDIYGTHGVSQDVISSMRVILTADKYEQFASNSCLLNDESSIPFFVENISMSMEQIEISDVEPPPLIRCNSGFSFLLSCAD